MYASAPMMKTVRILFLLLAWLPLVVPAQTYNQIDESGNIMQRDENQNFNPHNNDTTRKSKIIPKGLKVWTVDRKFGDIYQA